MFNRIPILYLAESYLLLYKECLELADKLVAYIEINNGYILADNIDELADFWLKNTHNNKKVQSVGNKISIELAYNIMSSINEKADILTKAEKDYAAMRCFILGAMTVDKREAVLFLHRHGYTLKKEVKGLSRSFVQNIINPTDTKVINYHPDEESTLFRHLLIEKRDTSVDETKEQILIPLNTNEEILGEIGKWHALEPANEAIHVGLMRLQDSPYREIYSKVFGEVTGEFTKAMREKIRRRWNSFLNLADDRGIPRKTLEDMVSPR